MLWAFLCLGARAAEGPTVLVEGAHLSVDGQVEMQAETLSLDSMSTVAAQEVTATVEDPPMTIAAPKARWDLDGSVAHFSGGVTATHGDLTLRCDSLTVWYSESDRVERAEATGEVVAIRGAHRAAGDRAVLEDGRVVLTGTPTLEDGRSHMTGARIVFLENTVECLDCQMQIESAALESP